MTEDDFLRELRIALQGRIPQSQVNQELSYYQNYIIEESRKGRTKEQVIFDLGEPALIAKTVVASYENRRKKPSGGLDILLKRFLKGIYLLFSGNRDETE